jgi:hypothetical protein
MAACPLPSRFGHRLDRVMHRRSFTAGVPLPARAIARPGRCRPRRWHRRRSWGSALRGFAPTRGFRGVSAARTHLPFSLRLLPPPAVAVYVSSGASGEPPPTGVRGSSSAAAGRGSWASSPRAMRSVAWQFGARAAAAAALGFASLRVVGRPPSCPVAEGRARSSVRSTAEAVQTGGLCDARSSSVSSLQDVGRSWVLPVCFVTCCGDVGSRFAGHSSR